MEKVNVAIIVTEPYTLSSEQTQYLLKATKLLLHSLELTLLIVTSQELPILSLANTMVEIVASPCEYVTIEYLEKQHITILITPDKKHLAYSQNQIIVGLYHNLRTLYPIKIILEIELMKSSASDQLLKAIATIQQHPHFLVLVSLIRKDLKQNISQFKRQFQVDSGQINSDIFQVNSDITDILKLEEPTIYFHYNDLAKYQSFTGHTSGVLYI